MNTPDGLSGFSWKRGSYASDRIDNNRGQRFHDEIMDTFRPMETHG